MTARLNGQTLPDSWVGTSVGELFQVLGGGTPSTAKSEYWDGDIPWITSADIHGLEDIRPRKAITESAIAGSATNLVPSGSIIVVTSRLSERQNRLNRVRHSAIFFDETGLMSDKKQT